MKQLLLGILMITAFPLSLWAQAAPVPSNSSQNLSLLFSSNLHGEVEPCG